MQGKQPVLLDCSRSFRAETGLELDSAVILQEEDGYAYITVTNNGGNTVKWDTDTEVGHAEAAEGWQVEEVSSSSDGCCDC